MARENRPNGRTGAHSGETGREVPADYRILILDDGGAPPELIQGLLETIFRKQPTEAQRMVRDIREGARVECGIHRFDVAETKACEAIDCAAVHGVEIKLTLETV